MAQHPREMRRKMRALPHEAALEILKNGSHGVLATADADGIPLATPLSYVILDDKLYFHCALVGHKLDNIAAQHSVCFCVVGRDEPVYTDDFTTLYESAVVHGTAAQVTDGEEKRAALIALCQKYLPTHMDKAAPSIEGSFAATEVVAITMQHVAGKSNCRTR